MDNVRTIIDEVVYTPTHTEKKVYIIDEVHMLTTGAFNALLKTLEEPPEHVLFILATTEPHKLPATVLSRCQRFDFRRISMAGLTERLLLVAREEGISLTKDAVTFIASLSEGAMRDGISLLDQCISTGKNPLDLEDIHEIIGVASGKLIIATAGFLIERRAEEAISAVDQLFSNGKDPGQFLQSLVQLFRDILVYKTTGSEEALLSMTDEEHSAVRDYSGKVSVTEALAAVRELSELEAAMKWSQSPRILLEMAFLRICDREMDAGSNILDRLKLLEDRIRQLEQGITRGGYTAAAVPAGKDHREAAKPVSIQEPVMEMEKPKKKKIQESRNSFADWNRVVEELKNIGRMKVYSSLVDSTAVWIDEATVGIILPAEDMFRKIVLTKSENLDAIADAIKRCIGQIVQVRLIQSEEEKKHTEDAVPDKIIKFAEKNGLKLDIIED